MPSQISKYMMLHLEQQTAPMYYLCRSRALPADHCITSILHQITVKQDILAHVATLIRERPYWGVGGWVTEIPNTVRILKSAQKYLPQETAITAWVSYYDCSQTSSPAAASASPAFSPSCRNSFWFVCVSSSWCDQPVWLPSVTVRCDWLMWLI